MLEKALPSLVTECFQPQALDFKPDCPAIFFIVLPKAAPDQRSATAATGFFTKLSTENV
jgi:hypothetical protein